MKRTRSESESANAHALAILKGRKVIYCEEWNEGVSADAAGCTFDLCRRYKVGIFIYDAIGVGVGAKTHFNVLLENSLYQAQF